MPSISSDKSRFIQTSWMLQADVRLDLPDELACIRTIDAQEAQHLSELAAKRNVFARHSWENDFYINRLASLSGKTVIEFFQSGNPDDIISYAQRFVKTFEHLAILSCSFGFSRVHMQRSLAVRPIQREVFDITIGPDFHYLRSKAQKKPKVRGIKIDLPFLKRFERLAFSQVLSLCASKHSYAERVNRTIRWIFESRIEPSFSASVVKSAIALETCLIQNPSEPLSQTLAERTAFLLSDEAQRREKLAKVIKKFYSSRSAIVHGDRRKRSEISIRFLEGIDRIVLLLCVVLSSNIAVWGSFDDATAWCEACKWGSMRYDILRPFSARDLSNAIQLCDFNK